MLDLRTIARACGGEVVGTSALCPGPGHSAKDRSLAVSLSHSSPYGFVVFSFAGDDFAACRDHVLTRLGLPLRDFQRRPAPAPAPRISVKEDADQLKRIGWAMQVWEASRPLPGTLVEKYLASRGLPLEGLEDGEALRFHPALKFDGGHVPAMVALLRDVITNEACGVHRTFLSPDGRKLDRKMLGRATGAAIKLDPDDEVTMGLAIGEGLETTMSARLMGLRPAWALGSASAIAAFPVLPGIEAIAAIADADAAGQSAATTCARRWAAAGLEARIITPRRAGADLNDIVKNGAAA